jgi:hypothetical protein
MCERHLRLLDLLEFFRVVAPAAICRERALVMVADHFADFFIAMSRANLIDHDRLALKGHQLRRLSTHAPARVVGMDGLLLFDLFTRLFLMARDGAMAGPQSNG